MTENSTGLHTLSHTKTLTENATKQKVLCKEFLNIPKDHRLECYISLLRLLSNRQIELKENQ